MTFAVVILSARATNLVPCVRALLAAEPALPPERIIVVDDGARGEAAPQLPPVRWVTGAKPFVFARNANLGIAAACAADTILLNDDARLITPGGFSALAAAQVGAPTVGLCSAAISGVVGNPRQRPAGDPAIRVESATLAFVCVYIPRRVYAALGPLDERFAGYGFDDNDYCARAVAQGWHLGIYDGCVVEHGSLPSTFRSRPDIMGLLAHNRRLFEEKGRQEPPMETRRVDLFYLAWNRLEFTRETFAALAANTDWSLVRKLVVYDDGSDDGTDAWLEGAVSAVPVPVRFERTRFGSPVTAMLDFIRRAQAPILAKVDNDAMMPPGWLRQSLAVLDRHPELDLLGLEAMNPHSDEPDTPHSYTPAEFISGLGLYRRVVFAASQPVKHNRYCGLEEWQVAQGPRLRRGWINPALPVFLLDRMPIEPWASLSASYVRRGWQRHWPAYDPGCTLWHWRWPNDATTAERPAGRRLNVCYCDERPRPGFENVTHVPFPGPVDLDLRAPWPWEESVFAHVHAHELAEHLPDPLHTMNELWRVLVPGGTAEIAVPTTDGTGAFQDPTHVSFWNRRSFRSYEAGAPERDHLARRASLCAAFTVLHEHREQSIDGPRLTILLRAVKPGMPVEAERSAEVTSAPPAPGQVPALVAVETATGDGRLLCALRVKDEATYIGEVLERALPLCGRALIMDDHSTDATPAICRQFGARVTVVNSPFTGLDEMRDKNYLLQKIIAIAPEWVVWIDGDEVMELSGPDRIRQAIRESPTAAIFWLQIAYLWDQPEQVRIDGLWGRFFRPSVFRLAGQQHASLAFRTTHAGGNLHCGNVPQGLSGATRRLDVRLKHYGYLNREQRQAKYRWYNQVDPTNDAEDHYRHLAEIPGARFAPGPARFTPWRE